MADERTGRAPVVSAIDNLVKGAAGQTVQNMNLMLGLGETHGLLGCHSFRAFYDFLVLVLTTLVL